MVQLLLGKDAVAASHLYLAREALVAELGAAREVGLAALLDLGALELREAVVEDVALAVVALVRARLGEELVAPLPLREALRLALGEDVRAAERESEARRRGDEPVCESSDSWRRRDRSREGMVCARGLTALRPPPS